jgi:hypothetical protein
LESEVSNFEVHKSWWNQQQKERVRCRARVITIPNKLQKHTQGVKNVEEYYTNLEVANIRINIEKSDE